MLAKRKDIAIDKALYLFSIILLVHIFLFSCSSVRTLVRVNYAPDLLPGKTPDRIILNLTEDPSTSMAVTWRTDTTVTRAIAQIIKAQPEPQIPKDVAEFVAKTEYLISSDDQESRINAYYHSVVFKALNPNTKYMYRVGDDKVWSEWYHFKTAAKKDAGFSFIYLGDVQNNIKAMGSRVIREAYATYPDAGFIIYAGDLINHSGSDGEWGELFYAGGFLHAMIPSAMTPGNHEYGKGMILDPHWEKQFTLPQNGPKGLKERCFFVDYQDLRLISLDADMIDEFDWAKKAQQVWLDSILTHNSRKWTAVMLHYPFFSTKYSRDNPELRAAFGPILEKHKVDIVLAGHDHAYGRGMKNIPSFTDTSETTGTMFVVSVSGPKMYDLADKSWMTRRARNNQMFQIISIQQDTLSFKAYTATRELYDAFDLIKQQGGKNKLIDKAPEIPERL